MYGVVFSFKEPFDTKDMRSTGVDRRYDIDFPARDHVLVEQLRNKGAISFAKAVNTEYNGRPDAPEGSLQPAKVLPSTLGYQRGAWGGNPSNPYDTTRAASLALARARHFGECQHGHVQSRRRDESVPRAIEPQRRGTSHKAMLGFEGGAMQAASQRACARGRFWMRRKSWTRCEIGRISVLRPARSVHDCAALVDLEVLHFARQGRWNEGSQGTAYRSHHEID